MGFDIGAAINSTADRIVASDRAKTIASSPIYTSILITVCIFFILIFVFRDVDGDETVAVLSMRGSFYVFIVLIGVLFLHNRVLMADTMSEQIGTKVAEIFDGGSVGDGVVTGGEWTGDADIVPISISAEN